MFKLLRYFSVTSFIAFVIVAALLGVFYRQIVLKDLIIFAENKNVALSRAFSNSLWPQVSPFVASASDMPLDELRTHPEIANLYVAVLTQMAGTSVVKVKVYNLEGLTVFSTEASQIGDDKSSNAGFLAARSGQVASELTHRDTFSSFEETIEDRDVFSSYIPIQRGGPITPVEGVFEIYEDVTPLLQRLEQAQRKVIIGVTAILTILYAILFFIVRRANNVIHRQYGELKRNETELAQARDQALEGSRLKSELLAKVSHELRTPLSAIVGFAELLELDVYGPISKEQAEPIAEIIDSTEYLTALVGELLDQSKLDAGQMRLNVDTLSPTDIVAEIYSKMHVLAEAKGLSLTTNISSNLPATVAGDEVRLQQILINLVGNAIKFSERGGVQICLYCSNATQWAMEVVDTGPGIPAEAQSYIFDPFRQADGSTTRLHGGTGLGLSIVKQLTTLMGGQVKLLSEVGRGSTFTILLPIFPTHERFV